jgi:RNA polymerase sigma factor (sigma-70 family)
MSALLQTPANGALEPDAVVSDHKLVAQVRRGDDRAFELLYERYHRRIHAYVFGMVKDHQRAEDVTQEVFVSALRRMRATERPIAFKPWVYEIAKNACIDQFRRSKRAEEVSFDAEEGLAPSDYGRLVSPEPVPDAALAAKQQLEQVVGAFGGLSDAHHEILVLRELEGLSYREIGDKMGMSRPAVESTLFRARRRLSEEYDELASGQRCLRIQSIITNASSGRLGARDTRRLARHVAHCQPCRRQAVAAGVDSALVARRSARERAIEKVAALFPLPLLLRGRRGGSGDTWASQLPLISDHAAAGGAKLAAVAAIVVAGLGAGVSTQVGADDRPAGVAERTIQPRTVESSTTPVADAVAAARSASDGRAARTPVRRRGDRVLSAGRRERAAERRQAASQAPGATTDDGSRGTLPGGITEGASGAPDASQTPSTPDASAPSAPSAPTAEAPSPQLQLPSSELPVVSLPQRTVDVTEPIAPVVDVPQTVTDVQGGIDEVTSGATAPIGDTTDALGLPLGG